jgi:hypothetical protein
MLRRLFIGIIAGMAAIILYTQNAFSQPQASQTVTLSVSVSATVSISISPTELTLPYVVTGGSCTSAQWGNAGSITITNTGSCTIKLYLTAATHTDVPNLKIDPDTQGVDQCIICGLLNSGVPNTENFATGITGSGDAIIIEAPPTEESLASKDPNGRFTGGETGQNIPYEPTANRERHLWFKFFAPASLSAVPNHIKFRVIITAEGY